MKALLIFLLVNFVYLNAHCQTSERFNFQTSDDNNAGYTISLKLEKPLSKNSRVAGGRFIDEPSKKKMQETFHSIVEKSIPTEKLQKLIGRTFVSINFSLAGKAIQVRVHTLKENMEVFDEDNLYTLFSNLLNMEVDMSTYEITWTQDPEDFLAWMFTL
ncbi:MAG: hypothetical protein FWG79_03030 [Bacteroidales bacterium]|nr:hypothetical protein [Bacteroidales bacterium]